MTDPIDELEPEQPDDTEPGDETPDEEAKVGAFMGDRPDEPEESPDPVVD